MIPSHKSLQSAYYTTAAGVISTLVIMLAKVCTVFVIIKWQKVYKTIPLIAQVKTILLLLKIR